MFYQGGLWSAFSCLSILTALCIAQDSTSPTPYAQPSGLSDDITQWLAVSAGSQIATCKSRMLANINIQDAALGTVVASTSTESPNYHYNWVRDAALTMDVVVKLYAAATDANAISTYEQILFQYAQARADEQNDPSLQTGLGEPKFELNNSVFTGPWGRPQNDGPAESATTLIEFAQAYLNKGGDVNVVNEKIWNSSAYGNQAPLLKDLQFVASNWSSKSFDLWEEVSGDHFFNRMVSHKALADGAILAAAINDSAMSTFFAAAQAVGASLSAFWNAEKQMIVYEAGAVRANKSSYKDIAVILGILHGYNDDDLYTYSDEQVLVTAYKIATSFLSVFPISKVTTDASGGVLGIPIGRYPEDLYNGTGTAENGGNPWFLATAAMAEYMYHVSAEIHSSNNLTATNTSQPFWGYFAPAAELNLGQSYTSSDAAFGIALSALEGWGDAFMRRIKYHTQADQRLTEQYNRNNGISQGATDLTWSYASVLTAAFARAVLTNDTAYVGAIANLA